MHHLKGESGVGLRARLRDRAAPPALGATADALLVRAPITGLIVHRARVLDGEVGVKKTYDPDSRFLDLYAKAVQRR